MIRRIFILAVMACLMAGQSFAQTPQDHIVAQLIRQGYTSVEVSRTWLGRTRIIAINDVARREIVLNPRTGEILRDFWVLLSNGQEDARDIIDYGGVKQGGYDDYDDDKDNSGSGSSNSGSGSGNSGSGSSNSGSGSSGGGSDDD